MATSDVPVGVEGIRLLTGDDSLELGTFVRGRFLGIKPPEPYDMTAQGGPKGMSRPRIGVDAGDGEVAVVVHDEAEMVRIRREFAPGEVLEIRVEARGNGRIRFGLPGSLSSGRSGWE